MVEGSVFGHVGALESNLSIFIVQLLLILGLTRALVVVLKPLKQPAVIAEVISGILLGPSVLSRVQSFKDTIFPEKSIPQLQLFANVALILFMFTVGLELDWKVVTRNIRKSIFVSLSGIIIPFGLGAGVAVIMYDMYKTASATYTAFLLFTGTAMSITAFPVLARIMSEMRLLGTDLGGAVMNAAAVDDVIAWSILALVIAIARATDGIVALYTVLSTLAFLLVLGVAVRPILNVIAVRLHSKEHVPAWFFILSVMLCFLCAWTTELLGVHAIFGAFTFGVAMPRVHNVHVRIGHRIEDLVVSILLPLYFTFSGLRTQFNSLADGTAWGMVVLVIAAAVLGKLGGCTIAAHVSGMPWREALTTGVFMNAKGLVELIVLNVGLDLGVLSNQVFSIFVFMALITTFMTVPLVHLVYPPDQIRADDRKRHEEAHAAKVSADSARVKSDEEAAHAATDYDGLRSMLLAATNPLDAAAMVSLAYALLPRGFAHRVKLQELANDDASAFEAALRSKSTPIILLHTTSVSDRPSSYLRELGADDAHEQRVLPVSLLIDSSSVASSLAARPDMPEGTLPGTTTTSATSMVAESTAGVGIVNARRSMSSRTNVHARALPSSRLANMATRLQEHIQQLQFDFVIAMATERARSLGESAASALAVGVLHTADVRRDITEEASVFSIGMLFAAVHLTSQAPTSALPRTGTAAQLTSTSAARQQPSLLRGSSFASNTGGGDEPDAEVAPWSIAGAGNVVSSVIDSLAPLTLHDQLLTGLVATGKPLILLLAPEQGYGIATGVLGPQCIHRALLIVSSVMPEADREMLAILGHALVASDNPVVVDVICVDDQAGATSMEAAMQASRIEPGSRRPSALSMAGMGDVSPAAMSPLAPASPPVPRPVTLPARPALSERGRFIVEDVVRCLAYGKAALAPEGPGSVLSPVNAAQQRELTECVQIVHSTIAADWIAVWVASTPANNPIDAIISAGQRVDTLQAAIRGPEQGIVAPRARSDTAVVAAQQASPAAPAADAVGLAAPDGVSVTIEAPPSNSSSAHVDAGSRATSAVSSVGSGFDGSTGSIAVARTTSRGDITAARSRSMSVRRGRASTLTQRTRFGDGYDGQGSPCDFVPLPSAGARSALVMRALALDVVPQLPRRTLSVAFIPAAAPKQPM